MKEDLDIYYKFGVDDPGDIVEALNEDKSIILWDINADGSGVMIKIDYNGLQLKKVKNGTNIRGISNGGA
jgi:hypothetical protein